MPRMKAAWGHRLDIVRAAYEGGEGRLGESSIKVGRGSR